MKIVCLAVGPTEPRWLREGVQTYLDRLARSLRPEWRELPNAKVKTKDHAAVREAEGQQILATLQPGDHVILLDERGEQPTSRALADRVERLLSSSHRRVVFVIGGAFGFSEAVRARSNLELALSRMTFSHQMVRLFFAEQLFRAMSILRNEPYHND